MIESILYVIIAVLIVLWACAKFLLGAVLGININGGHEYAACGDSAYTPAEIALRRKPRGKFSPVLLPGAPRLPYRSGSGPFMTIHHGQRKLLLAEVAFLTAHGGKSKTVVYAGASPGTHIQMLLDLFPHEFHLYDPRPITWRHPRMTAYEQLFTDADAAAWTGKDVLFISDIRAGSDDVPDRDVVIEEQMLMQQEWCRIMKPAMASLKFRLSWDRNPHLEYLDGEIHIQPWAPLRSTETRLWTDCATKTTWDTVKYDEQMFAHNLVTRQHIYDSKPLQIPGYDGCWDCQSERLTWEEFIEASDSNETVADLMTRATDLLHQPLDMLNHGKYIAATLEGREKLCRADPACVCRAAPRLSS